MLRVRRSLIVILLIGCLLASIISPLAVVTADPPKPTPTPTRPAAAPPEEKEPRYIEPPSLSSMAISALGNAHSGIYALTDSPEGNYTNNADTAAQIAQAFDLSATSWPILTFWHRYAIESLSGIIPHSGSYALTDSPSGNYSNYTDAAAQITQAFDFTSTSSPVLTFWHYYAIETYYDDADVEVSTNGLSWTSVAHYDGYQSTYTRVSIDLSAYNGNSTVYIRFRLRTDYSVTRDGWIIDDVSLDDGSINLFSDDCESTSAWTLDLPWGLGGREGDRADVEVSTNGLSWTSVATYSGFQNTYTQASISLSSYNGNSTVYIRFRLRTDDINTYDGWYIDDVSLDDGATNLFSDDCEDTDAWTLQSPWGLTIPNEVAYVYGTNAMYTVGDDLQQLVNEGRLQGYDIYTESNIDELWAKLNQYATLLIDEDCMFYWTHPDPGNPNPIPDSRYPIALSFYNHKPQLDRWIFNGGGLFSTDQNDISDLDEVTWTWLPDALQVRSVENSSDPDRYGHDPDTLEVVYDPGLFSYPNQIDVRLVAEYECHGHFTHYPGYTAMVRDNVYGDVLEIYRRYGAGVVVLSHLEYETAHPYDVDYVENELHFILVSVNVTANYPNVNGKLDIYATAHCAIHGDLTDVNTQLATYDIRDSQSASTGIAGALIYDPSIAKWKATDIDISALEADVYTVLVSFEDIGGHTGSGTDSFAKGIGSAEVGVSSPYALEGDTVFIYATVWDDAGNRDVSGAKTVTVTVTGISDPLVLSDSGSEGDLHQLDGEYSAWCELVGTGAIDIDLYVEGHEMDSASLTIITDPELLILTDIQAQI